ncbi:VOC family protein [Planococcus shixiaomingii]|uniref:VOC family protein n=1 Tax=Planococcus shixiaomingii TaxID=3058393 RepID=UPI0026019F8C|nr:VOC family protein [Planococcus sp. N022]WKA54196.1 VOC family protein [Planococcus sp. N022]
MISKVGQIMLYVNNQDEVAKFWTEKFGFEIVSEDRSNPDMKWIEIAPSKDSETSIILHDREVVAKMSPELNLGTPSLMFFTDNVEELYREYSDRGITVGEIVELPTGKVFNFADNEDNYFAVMEKS